MSVDAEFVEHEATAAPSSSLAVVDPATFCLPVVSAEDAKAAMARYMELCEAVLDESDYQPFPQKVKDPVTKRWVETTKKFKKKSAVKKLQTFWGVSVKIKSETRDDLGEGHFGFRCVATATARDGREVEASGGCSTHEERFEPVQYDDESAARYAARVKKMLARSYHDVLATAETRATNRAVMNCIGVGGGEVTADEMSASRSKPETAPREPAKAQETHSTAAAARPKGRSASEVALAAFEIARALGVCPDDKIMFRDYVKEKFPGGSWGSVLATLEAQLARAGEDPLASAFAEVEAQAQSEAVTPEASTHRKLELRVLAKCAERKIDTAARHEMAKRLFARTSLKDLTETQLAEMGDMIERGEAA